MAVTVMTKKSGRPLVTGLVGVSTITCREKTVLLSPGFWAAEETKTLVNGGKRVLIPLRAGQSLAEEKEKEGLVMKGRAVPVILNH